MANKEFYQPDQVESSQKLAEFCESFWINDKTTNHFISMINRYSPYGERVRREKNPTIIYCIGIDVPKDRDAGKWLLCKVGLTQGDQNEPGNRMDRVKNKITKACKDLVPKTIFELPVSAIDTSSIFAIEDRVRQRIGIRVDKKAIASWQLPNKTEWVLTTKEYVEKLGAETRKNDATTDLFNYPQNTLMAAHTDHDEAERIRKFCANHPLPDNLRDLFLDRCVIKGISDRTQHVPTSPRHQPSAQQNLLSDTQSNREDGNMTSSTTPKRKGKSKTKVNDSKEDKQASNSSRNAMPTGPALNSQKVDVLIVGDSMVESNVPSKLAQQQIIYKSLPCAARIEDAFDVIYSNAIEWRPDELILHLGTNNMANDDKNENVAKIELMVDNIIEQTSVSSITISSIIHRAGESSDACMKVNDVNAALKLLVNRRRWSFIDNRNVDGNLTADGVHLNDFGIRVREQNIIAHLCEHSSGAD